MIITQNKPRDTYVEFNVDLDVNNKEYLKAKTLLVENKNNMLDYLPNEMRTYFESKEPISLKFAVIINYMYNVLKNSIMNKKVKCLHLKTKYANSFVAQEIIDILRYIDTQVYDCNEPLILYIPKNDTNINKDILESNGVTVNLEPDLSTNVQDKESNTNNQMSVNAGTSMIDGIIRSVQQFTLDSVQNKLIEAPNPVVTFASHIPRIGNTLAYCIQGADAINEIQYKKFVVGIFDLLDINVETDLVSTMSQSMTTYPALKSKFIELKNMDIQLTARNFCSIVGNYEHLKALEMFLDMYNNISISELLKYYLVADHYKKVLSYNVTDGDWQRKFYQLCVLMGNSVLIINPTHNINWNFIRYINKEYEYPILVSVEKVLENVNLISEPIVTNTSTFTIMNEINSNSATVLDDRGQKVSMNFVKGTFEDVQAYWDLPYAMREGFENTGLMLSVPIMFTSLKGIIKDRTFIKDMNNLFATAEIVYETEAVDLFATLSYIKDVKVYLKEDTFYNFKQLMKAHNYLSDETLWMLKRAVDTIINNNILKIRGDDGLNLRKAMPLFSVLNELTDDILCHIQEDNSFTGKPKQIIYYAQEKQPMSYEMACKLTLYAFIGCFDVLIWSPYKYKTIDDHINTQFLHTINLPDIDLNFKYRYKKSMLNRIFS